MTHFEYLLGHADDNLILSHRYGEWISRAPELEEDIALANIGLDHLGVARLLLTHAGELEGEGRDEDDLAMFRHERQFRNLILVEQPNGDFAHTMTRAFFFDTYQLGLWDALTSSTDRTLAGIAGKALKETRYHHRHSSGWVIRLGDGTDESHRRMRRAVEWLWPFTAEMFTATSADRWAATTGIGVDPATLLPSWERSISEVFARAGLDLPSSTRSMAGGRSGLHSEHLGHILGEMQWLARSMPGVTW